jgi:hypothetical protein
MEETGTRKIEGGFQMKTFVKLFGIAVITVAILVSMTGCITQEVGAPVVTATIVPVSRDYVILGVVNFEKNQRLEVSYADLLAEAIKLFPTANAVLDVRIEPVVRTGVLLGRNVYAATGIAVQYVTQPSNH